LLATLAHEQQSAFKIQNLNTVCTARDNAAQEVFIAGKIFTSGIQFLVHPSDCGRVAIQRLHFNPPLSRSERLIALPSGLLLRSHLNVQNTARSASSANFNTTSAVVRSVQHTRAERHECDSENSLSSTLSRVLPVESS
jgi:hypothetical protein